MKALPLILAGGAALVLLGGKKKSSGKSSGSTTNIPGLETQNSAIPAAQNYRLSLVAGETCDTCKYSAQTGAGLHCNHWKTDVVKEYVCNYYSAE